VKPMDLQLKGKKVLVTGSTAGIGFASARAFSAEGASVIINGRTQERVDTAIREIRKLQPSADLSGVAADVSNAAGCAKLIQTVPDVDVLVNNMGIFEPKPFEKIPDEDWLGFFEANVMSGVRLSRHYLPSMRRRNWGRILFVSSESGVQIPVEMIHYGMTKTAQIAVARVPSAPSRVAGYIGCTPKRERRISVAASTFRASSSTCCIPSPNF